MASHQVQTILPPRFTKHFWDEIGDDVIQSINHAICNCLYARKEALYNRLTQKDKPTNQLKTNHSFHTNYKIATKAIAKRLGKVLPDIISPNQTCYLKKRHMSDLSLMSLVMQIKEIARKSCFRRIQKSFRFNRMGLPKENPGSL